jgi:4-aminobutyrate aminotransferase
MGTHLSDVWFQLTDLQVVSGKGAVVTTEDGTEYLDFTSGIGVVNTGHCHPKVVEAIQRQAERFVHAQVNCYRHPLLERLAARLAEITPESIDCFFYANSGAEATEAAVKLARQATGRPHVVVFQGSFHGRTAQTMAMTTSKAVYRAGHAPLPSGVFVAPFPYTFLTKEEEGAAVQRCLTELRTLLATQTAPSETAALVIEPVLGEGGYVPAPAEFLRGLEAICREHGILFVMDEVQTGFGRTGTMFATEQAGVSPDIMVFAKGLGSGFPISAIGASGEIMSRWPTGSHGGTYGGNPMGCAAALATIDVLTSPGFLEGVRERGEQLMSGLRELRDRHEHLAEVRGRGLMVGCEIVDEEGRPDGPRAAAILRHCLRESRLILMTAGPHGATIRWIPPLIVSREQIDAGLQAFERALTATSAELATA